MKLIFIVFLEEHQGIYYQYLRYVASDLFALSKEAAVEAVKRIVRTNDDIVISAVDFESALKKV